MNKKLMTITSILLIILALGIQITYAITIPDKKNFFEINKLEISPKETLEMTFNIANINYDNFKILLNSNVNVKDIEIENTAKLDVETTDSNVISIEVNKKEMKLDKISLYYMIPENIEIGTKIQLIAQVVAEIETVVEGNKPDEDTKPDENTDPNASVEENISNTQKENVEITKQIVETEVKEDDKQEVQQPEVVKKEEVVLEEKLEVTIVKKSEDNNEDNNEEKPNQNIPSQEKPNGTDNNIPSGVTPNINKNTGNTMQMPNLGTTTKPTVSYTSNLSATIETETAVYNGSNNNYLETLTVEGIELNTNFNKENGTYFISINEQTSLNITATAENDDAKVCVTGSDNLQTGENKILISVTAENGDVRYYRIFVSKEG